MIFIFTGKVCSEGTAYRGMRAGAKGAKAPLSAGDRRINRV